MLEEEAECTTTNNNNKSETSNEINNAKPNGISDSGVTVVNASAKWRADLVRDSLSNITFHVPEGKLCAVIGPVGSGKVKIKFPFVNNYQSHIGLSVCRLVDRTVSGILILSLFLNIYNNPTIFLLA